MLSTYQFRTYFSTSYITIYISKEAYSKQNVAGVELRRTQAKRFEKISYMGTSLLGEFVEGEK
jgi:hypothetical protein